MKFLSSGLFSKAIAGKVIHILITIIVLLAGYIFVKKGYSVTQECGGGVYLSIGTSLIATGIVSFFELFRELIKEGLGHKINNIILEAGIGLVSRKRDLDIYDSLMSSASQRVDITGYSLRAFYESYSDIIKKKIRNGNKLKIRMLVVDPESTFSTDRENLEGYDNDSGVFKNSIKKILSELSEYDKELEVRKICTPLSTMFFRIDDTMFVGPHFYKKSSKSTVTYQIEKYGWLFDEYQEEFERMWKDATIMESAS